MLWPMIGPPRTCRTLTSQAKAFKQFAELIEIHFLPLTAEEFCLYAIWLYIVR